MTPATMVPAARKKGMYAYHLVAVRGHSQLVGGQRVEAGDRGAAGAGAGDVQFADGAVGEGFPWGPVLQEELADDVGIGADELFKAGAVVLDCLMVALQLDERVVVVPEVCGVPGAQSLGPPGCRTPDGRMRPSPGVGSRLAAISIVD